ncbi:MAG: PAS domain S-box protein, partial [Desulfobacteraceae bacterium]|nr:PAS domain S-box protein [Desulfobacteraceae bacterium]
MDDIQNKLPKDLLSAALNNPYEHIIIVDTKGMVRFISRAFEKYAAISAERALGKYIKNVIPESELPRVLKSGKAEIGEIIHIQGEHRV